MKSVRADAVVFDFGGVLVNWRPELVVADMFADQSLQQTIMRSIFRHPDWLEIDRGSLSETAAVARFVSRTGVDAARIRELLVRIRDSLILIPEMEALVRDLVAREIPVYGLSNMSVPTFEHLAKRYDIWELFDGILISGRVGLVKPEAEIYQRLLDDFDLVERASVFVDDLHANVAAAERIGFRAMLFEDPTTCRQELERSLGV